MNYYKEIKNELINNEITKRVKDYSKNRSDLNTYYKVGKLLLNAGNDYGEGIIKDYSIRLTKELGKGYSERNLRNMRQFYKVSIKWQTLSAKLNWSHYCEIIWFDDKKFIYYIKISEQQCLLVRQLRERNKNKEYERLPEETKIKLMNNVNTKVNDKKYTNITKDSHIMEVNEEDLPKTVLILYDPNDPSKSTVKYHYDLIFLIVGIVLVNVFARLTYL